MPKSNTTYGAFEAKTHLSALLDRVEKGERIIITRHGREIAVLEPSSTPDLAKRQAMIDRALAMSKGTSLPKGKTIRDLIDEGRKW
jgi:prevent-host-death family protein